MRVHLAFRHLALTAVLFLLACSAASAQQFSVLIDGDRNAATGCSVSSASGTVTGIEWRVTATVSGEPPQVSAVERARCVDGAFAAPIAQAAGYPVGLNNGLNGSDVVEFAAALVDLTGLRHQVTLHFLAQSAGGTDLLGGIAYSVAGISPAPVLTSPAIIPTLHWFGLSVIIFAVLLLAFQQRALRGVAAVLMLVGAGLVWAANFIPDGQVGDWATETPLATSPAPSSTDGARDNDIVAVWAADEASRFFFRVDVLDLEDQAPVANAVNVTTLENQAVTIGLSGSDTEGAALSFSIVQPPANGSLGAISQLTDTTAEVTYTPALDFAGNDSFTYRVNDGLNESAPATVSIAVTGINDAPSFTAGPDQTVNEDAGPQTVDPWATAIDDGDPEVAQGLSFEIVGNTNPALFSAGPSVSATGVLTYTPADDANGSASITLQLRDDGGTANGGVDVSPPQSFSITVNPVNDAPSFVIGPNQAVDEDAGPQTVDPWATAISPGPADESGQVVSFSITGNSNPALFSVAPAVSPTGVLTYTPAPNANGVATIALILSDDGGTANGGVDTSAPQSFTISVNAVNNAPSFTVGPDQVVDEDAGPQLVDPWATDIDDGDPEVVQGLTFEIVGNTNAALFSAGPAVSASGALSYTTAPDAFGVASITLQLRDDGGTANGGVDVSPPQSFSITVNPVDDPPVAVDDAATVDEDSAATLIDVLANDTDVDGGPISIDSITQPANGLAAILGGGTAVEYTPDPDYCNTDPVAPADTFTYTLAPGGSTATVSMTVTCINDAPVNTVPGTQQTPDDDDLVFSTANGNAISVADVDAGDGLLQMTFSSGDPANGTLTLANPGGVLATLTGNGTDEVIATGTLVALNLALNGPDGSLTYSPPLGVSAGQTLTISTDDQGNTGLGGPLTDVSTIDISVDAAPVVSSSPTDGALVANNVAITVSFSELVDVTPGITLTCGGSNLVTGGSTGNGITFLNLSYTAPLPAGDCTLTVPAASVSDVDLVDPPDNPLADYIAIFTVDAAPEVTATTPGNGETVANDVALNISFSEPVDAVNAVTLSCGGPNLITGGASGTGVTELTPTYAAPLPAGACTLTVIAANIDDSDLADPPANPVADTVVNFTVDAAPAFVSATPDEAAVVGTGQTVSFTFDEPVDDLGGAITLNCGGAIAGSISGSGTATLTFTPAAALPEGASCTATAVALNIGDTDDFDPPDHPAANVVRSFSVDTAPTVLGIVPADGALDVNLDANITVTFSEPVNFTAAAFSLQCPNGSAIPFTVSGDGTDTATIDPTPATLPIDTLCVFSVDASLVTDVDAADPPDAGSGITTVSFTTVNDNPPEVIASTPGEGDTVANNLALSISFSEAIDAAANYATLTCGGPNLITAGQTGSNTSVLNPTYTGPLPNGANCTLTVLAANITDVDLIDPPDNMAADYVVNFSVDAAPEVTSTLPADGAVDVPTNTTITVNFSEAVDLAAGAITLNCGAPVSFTGGLPASNVTSIVLTPSANLPEGASCNGQVVATLVTDVDAIDPPDQMVANFNWSFATDAAPEVTAVTPAESAVVSTTQTITVGFSENVDLGAAAFTLDCGAGAIAMTGVPALPATNTPSIVLTPTGGLPEGAACVFTVVAAEVADSDSNDPPNTMVANFVRNFSVDAAPFVTGTTPANAATGVDPTSNITVTFSESVNFDTTAGAANTSFDLECPGATGFTVLTASPASSVVLNPVDNEVAGANCTLTVRASGITDADAIDPPDTMAADFSASFSFASVANDDAYTVTPHLTLAIGAGGPQGGGVLANDILGAGAITGFGFAPACSGTPPGSQLDAGAANGRLTLNADGSLGYEPPAGVANATRTFCYTVTGGDTANIVFTLQNTELVWFVNAAVAAGGIGTQARPFQTLGAAAAADTANDTIFLAFNATPYIGGITLEAGERLIGQGSSSDLATITGITPVAGSAFPALGGSAPTIVCSGVNCLTLGTGNTLRGLNVGNAGAAGTKIAGNAFGTLTVAELTLSGEGRALSLTTGTLNGNFIDLDVTSGNLQAIALDAVGGVWSVNAAVDIGNVSGTAIDIVNTPAGGTTQFLGGLNINKSSAGVGFNFNANSSPISLNAVSITTGAGTAVNIDSSTGTVIITGGNVTATGGAALSSSTSTVSITLSSASSTSSPAQGINLNAVVGSVSIAGGAISGSTGTAFQAQGTLGASSYAGAISKTTAGRLVDVSGAGGGTLTLSGNLSCTGTCGTGAGNHGLRVNARTAGTITFSGAAKTFSSSATNPGVSLTSNTGATINFTGGGLAINTTSGPGFEATGGGTVTVQGTANTITSTTGTALNVVNTSIGAADLNFRSITATGGTSGIVLNNTGSAGSLFVTGNGGACTSAATCTGGAIQNMSSHGIWLQSTTEPTLTNIFVNNTGHHGVGGTEVNGFSLTNSVISNSGTSLVPNRANVGFNVTAAGTERNLYGTVTITGNTLTNAQYQGIEIFNFNGTIDLVEISNNTLTSSTSAASSQGPGISLIAYGSAGTVANVTRANISNNVVTNFPGGVGIQAQGGNANAVGAPGTFGVAGHGTNIISITGNRVAGASLANRMGGEAIVASVSGNGQGNFNISNNGTAVNPITNITGIGISNSAFGNAQVTSTISNNVIVANNSFAAQGIGGGLAPTFGIADSPQMTVTVSNNTISQTDGNGILLVSRDTNGTLNARVLNNVVAAPLSGVRQGIRIDSGNGGLGENDTVCLNISGNTSSHSIGFPAALGIGLRKQGTDPNMFRFGIHGMAATGTPGVEAYVNGLNPSGGGTLLLSAENGFTSCNLP